MKKVSIIVPVYKVENVLERCIKSLINQTLKEIEIILVDDKAPDKSPKICDEYAKKDSRIKVIHKEHNEGAGYARNSGLRIATGEYIGFVDSDDYISKDYYEKLYNRAKKYSAEISYANVKVIYKKGKMSDTANNNIPFKEDYVNTDKVLLVILNPNIRERLSPSVWRAIYKSEIIKENSILFASERECFSEDTIFNVYFLNISKKATFVKDTYYYYCINENSLTKTREYKENGFEKCKKLLNELKNCKFKINDKETLNRGIEECFIMNIRTCIKSEKYNEKEKAIKNIKKICEDDVVQSILKKNRKVSLKQKIFEDLLKYKRARILYWIIKKIK